MVFLHHYMLTRRKIGPNPHLLHVVVVAAPTLPKVAGRLLILVGFLPDNKHCCGSNQGGRAAAGVKASLRPERLAMGKKQLNFKDFLRERGEDSLVTEDPVATGNASTSIATAATRSASASAEHDAR